MRNRAGLAFAILCQMLVGCTTFPTATELQGGTATYPGHERLPADRDARARFRQTFCEFASSAGMAGADGTACDDLLWRLSDEAPSPADAPPLPTLSTDLRIFVVSGAFGDCRLEDMDPFGREVERLAARGVRIHSIRVSGRSGAELNARQIAAALENAGLAENESIVLLGYSKGAVDILQFLVDEPALAHRVAAVVGVAGPIMGSPLAEKADWWYRKVFARSFSGFCDPGDGGVITSLLPTVRQQWLAEHALPTNVRYFSVGAFTTEEHLSNGLRWSWRMLAENDRRNDGQVQSRDAIIPGSTLLGYVNADHWDVAIALDQQLPFISTRPSKRLFPRGALLDAILLHVNETLHADASAAR